VPLVAAAAVALSAAAGQDTATSTPATPAAVPARTAPARRVTTRYDPWFRKYSKRYFGAGFDWRVFKAQAMAESDLKPTARSSAGARGIMQLMPSTYDIIASTQPHYTSIDDPQTNIAAGILHDRGLWLSWKDLVQPEDRCDFMLGSYNAGIMTIDRARTMARRAKLDPAAWQSIVEIAPKVRQWRYKETLGYVSTIQSNYLWLAPDESGLP